MRSSLFLRLTLFYGLLAYAQSPPQLGYIPLAVKTPYLDAWIKSPGGQSPAAQMPNFVSNDRVLAWGGMVRVDNQTYLWIGGDQLNSTWTMPSEITPSKSIFRVQAGPIHFNVTFFSPIEPTDYVRQSMPFSYMYIDGIVPNDSQPHTVQLYSDISAEWVSRDDMKLVKWNTTITSNAIYHAVQQQSPSPMGESGGISDDSTAYFAMVKRPGLTWQIGGPVAITNRFATNGTMSNTMDTDFRAVSNNWPVFVLSVDLGVINPGNQPDPVVWAIGLVRDPLVTYNASGFTQDRRTYFWSNYTGIDEAISAFLNDFPDAVSRSTVFDNKVLSAASTSTEYASILSLVTRQIFASMDITIPPAQGGQFNISDVKIFMKDIGRSQRTNPVEVIYGALPALTFFNPSMARDLLQPLLESSSQNSNPYAVPDLGADYPHVHDNFTDTHTLAVENCGNMLIMVYAHAAKSGDGTLLSRYYPVLQLWADYLIANSLHPNGFITADNLNNRDMSNLALKGILGVYSMAKINEAVGVSNTTYMDQATQLMKEWKQSAIATDGHIQAVYGHADSWGLMYNLYPAVWLQTGLIEDNILATQAQFYAQQSSPDFGLSLDSSQFDTAYPHWTLMTAATIPNNMSDIQAELIKSIYQRAYMPNSTSPLPITYKPTNGDALFGTGNGSPILGAAFAVAAMQVLNVNISAPQISSPVVSHSKDNVGVVVGGVLGGLAFLLLVTAGFFIFWRKHKRPHKANSITDGDIVQVSHRTITGGQWLSNRSNPSQPLPPSGKRNVMVSRPVQGALATPPISRKQREALLDRRVSVPSELPLLAPSNSDSASVAGAEELLVELEEMRREVESIRRTADTPPEYS